MAQSNSPSKSPNGKALENVEKQPGWAKGLRQLYDSVVEEPIPDNFQELLDKLDGDNP